ncbi:MAG: restriction endonuclease subunit S [Rhodocyclaceae bacterium]
MKYAAYQQYKPSQIEWIDSVPDHWEIWKIAHGFQMTGSGTTPSPDNPDWYVGDVCWVTTSELRETVITDTEKKISQEALENFSALKVFPEGALAIAMYGATIGRLGIFGVAAATNQACGVLFGQKAFDTKFVFYWLQAFREQIILLASGGSQPNISQEKVRSIRIACPSIDEQHTIARFLDAKTAQIDALLAQKRQLIDKLKEKRQALIARTVTRGLPSEAAKAAGLEPNPEMKDSGVDWLGRIPHLWASVPLSYLVKMRGGATPDKGKTEYWDGEIPWVSPKDMKVPRIFDAEDHISEKGLRNSPLSLIPNESLLIVVRGMILAHSFPVALSMRELTINQDMKALVCSRKIRPEYLYWALCGFSAALVALADESAHGTKKIEATILEKFPILVPPITEQQAITAYLDHETASIDQLTAKVESAITRLTEYRQALITSAVTGKIDVRGLA